MQEAIRPIIDALHDPNQYVQIEAIHALAASDKNRAVETLLSTTLYDDNSTIKGVSIRVLGELGDRRAVEPLIAMLDDPNRHIRAITIDALVALKDQRIISPLMNILHTMLKEESHYLPDIRTQCKIVQTLGDSSNKDVIPILLSALTHKEIAICVSAAEALGKLGDPQAIPPLNNLLRNGERKIRVAAANALRQLGDIREIHDLEKLVTQFEQQQAWERISTRPIDPATGMLTDFLGDVGPAPSYYISQFALAHNGTPWAVFQRYRDSAIICFWQNHQWHRLNGEFHGGAYLSHLFVSPSGDVYLSQHSGAKTKKDHYSPLYRLHDGQAEYVTDFRWFVTNDFPPLYFDSQGMLWNWGENFIAKFQAGTWESFPVTIHKPFLHSNPLLITEDRGRNVVFFIRDEVSENTIHIYVNGTLRTTIQLPFGLTIGGLLYSDDRVLLYGHPTKDRAVFNLQTMSLEESSPILSLLASYTFWGRPISDKKGAIWFVHHKAYPTTYHNVKAFVKTPKSVEVYPQEANGRLIAYCASDGTTYIAAPKGIYIYHQHEVKYLGWEQGFLLNKISQIVEGPQGKIWFVSREAGILVYTPQDKHSL